MTRSFSIFLRLNGVPFMSELRGGESIEPALAGEAATNGIEAQFAAIADSITCMENPEPEGEFPRENRLFHRLIAETGGNKVTQTVGYALSILADGDSYGIRIDLRNRGHILLAHRKVHAACVARDSAAAAAAMSEHVGELARLVRVRYPHLIEEPIPVGRRGNLDHLTLHTENG